MMSVDPLRRNHPLTACQTSRCRDDDDDEGVVGGDSIRWRDAQSAMTNWCK